MSGSPVEAKSLNCDLPSVAYRSIPMTHLRTSREEASSR
jgi:hypothetical protein